MLPLIYHLFSIWLLYVSFGPSCFFFCFLYIIFFVSYILNCSLTFLEIFLNLTYIFLYINLKYSNIWNFKMILRCYYISEIFDVYENVDFTSRFSLREFYWPCLLHAILNARQMQDKLWWFKSGWHCEVKMSPLMCNHVPACSNHKIELKWSLQEIRGMVKYKTFSITRKKIHFSCFQMTFKNIIFLKKTSWLCLELNPGP